MNQNGWVHTGSVILAVVTAAVSTVLWITNQSQAQVEKMIAVEFELAELRARVEAGGWSFRQQMLWIEALREDADHDIPSPSGFPHMAATRAK